MPLWAQEDEKFAVYYAGTAPVRSLAAYSLLVLDADIHPTLEPLLARKKTLLGYLSLGEIAASRPYFNKSAQAGYLLEENQHWKGSYAVDIRAPEWQAFVIEQLIPPLLMQGFHGIFIDTLDTPIELERRNPKAYHGMRDAAVALIHAIRLHYPDIKIMVNRAYPILPNIAYRVDMVLGESIFSSYNFASKTYGRVEKKLYLEQVEMLKGAKRQNPKLSIYTLDYCDKHDQAAINAVYLEQRQNGFIPYVATIGLDEIIPEPVK